MQHHPEGANAPTFSPASETDIWARTDQGDSLHAVSASAFLGLQATPGQPGDYVIQWDWLGLLP